MKPIVKIPALLQSRFLRFFLECKNPKAFLNKKKREYNETLIKSLKKKFNTIIETPATMMESEKDNNYILDQLELKPEHVSEEMRKISIHAFLEDLNLQAGMQAEMILKAELMIKEVISLIERTKSKMAEIGHLFGQFGDITKEIESIKNPKEISLIEPKVSSVYANIKTSFLSWSNLYEHQKKNVGRRVGPGLEKLRKNNDDILGVFFKVIFVSNWESGIR